MFNREYQDHIIGKLKTVRTDLSHIFVYTDHPFFVGVQYHPEYISRPMKPSPPYFGFLLASCGKLQGFINRGFRKSPHMSYEESSDEELSKFVENIQLKQSKSSEATGQNTE